MANFMKKLLPALTICALTACGGGGSNSSASNSSANPTQTNNVQYHVAGQVQKGPFTFGSNIWISELDDKLSPTGKVYMTQTKDDLGNFGIPGSVGTKLVELTGSGYYMNELTGTLSTAPVTLNAVADLSVSKSLTINLLTTLQAPRLKTLMANGSDYQAAYNQSRNEVLAVFGIDSGKVENLGSLFDMRINGTADQDSILLATSSILSQVAKNQAQQTDTETAELSHLISTIASDLAKTGKMGSARLQQQIVDAAAQIDLEAIRRNVETYYANRGMPMVAPKFEEWVDSDNSHILPRRVSPIAGATLQDVANAEVKQIITSNPIKISGLAINQSIPVYIKGTATIVKNNQIIKGNSTTAKEGDFISLQDRSGTFDTIQKTKLTIGATISEWSISSRSTKLVYDNGSRVRSDSGLAQTITSSYYAVRIDLNNYQRSMDTRYIGIRATSDGSDNYVAGIYEDNNGHPGNLISTPSRVYGYFDKTTKLPAPNDTSSFDMDNLQFSFGPKGFSPYGQAVWVVLSRKDGLPLNITPYANADMYGSTSSSDDGKNWSNGSFQINYASIWMAS